MREAELTDHLLEFTEEETFYRQYYMAKRSPGELEAFLSKLDAAYLSRRKYVLPELKSSLDLHFVSERWVWQGSTEDIYIHKHPRYMPEWDFVHEFYELVFAFAGGFILHVSGHVVEMEPGFVCLIPPGVHHHVSIFNNSISLNTKVRRSTFQTSFFPLLTGNDVLAQFFLNTMYIGDYKDYILFHSGNDGQLKKLFSKVYLEQYNREKYYSKMMNSLLSIIFSHLMRRHEDTLETAMSGQNRLKKLEAILSYIGSNYHHVTLGDLAREFHFTEQYLSKYIRENAGITFKEILRRIRLGHARELLEATDLTIDRVSEASGYANVEHFSRQFKGQYGMSPSAYRKEKLRPV